jgi:hypothetical protein
MDSWLRPRNVYIATHASGTNWCVQYMHAFGRMEVKFHCFFTSKLNDVKGKANVTQAWTGSEVSRKLRLPYFKTWRWYNCQPYAPATFTPKLVISVTGWVDPRATVQPEELSQWKMEPTTFRFVAQYLNQLRDRVPPTEWYCLVKFRHRLQYLCGNSHWWLGGPLIQPGRFEEETSLASATNPVMFPESSCSLSAIPSEPFLSIPHNSPTLLSMLNSLTVGNARTVHCFRVHPSTLPSKPRSPKWTTTFRITHQNVFNFLKFLCLLRVLPISSI